MGQLIKYLTDADASIMQAHFPAVPGFERAITSVSLRTQQAQMGGEASLVTPALIG